MVENRTQAVSGQLMEAAFANELYKASKMDSTEP